MITDDIRVKTMLDWLQNDLSLSIDNCEIASSDASFRRYFRVTSSENQYIVMDAPPECENIEPFISVAELLKQAQIDVPIIYHQNLKQGFLLLQDFGSLCFLDVLTKNNANELYQSACTSLLHLQQHISIDSELPHYDRHLLLRELDIFDDWYLAQYLDTEMPASLRSTLQHLLIQSALEQPVVCVHRDYHSRNLMLLPDNKPGIIDFQDAVIGPITYDLASLLRDCYIDWPEQQVTQWMADYFQQLQQAGLVNCRLNQFKRWFDLMGMQRHLKAIGIFARLHLRDGKSSYLKDIPRTLNYVLQVCDQYAELADIAKYLRSLPQPTPELTL